MATIHACVAAARERLRAAGIPPDEADLDARMLAEQVLGWDAAQYFTSGNQDEPEGFAGRYGPLVSRRERREPLSYISGHREFWNLDFEVSPAVLIPRPETELIVEIALELCPARSPLRIADVCPLSTAHRRCVHGQRLPRGRPRRRAAGGASGRHR